MVKDTVRGKYYFKDVKDFWLAETFSLECFLFFVLQGRRSFRILHCKKRLAVFPSPAGMSLTKLSLGGNNLIIPGQWEFGTVSDIPAEDGKIANLFYSVGVRLTVLSVWFATWSKQWADEFFTYKIK